MNLHIDNPPSYSITTTHHNQHMTTDNHGDRLNNASWYKSTSFVTFITLISWLSGIAGMVIGVLNSPAGATLNLVSYFTGTFVESLHLQIFRDDIIRLDNEISFLSRQVLSDRELISYKTFFSLPFPNQPSAGKPRLALKEHSKR